MHLPSPYLKLTTSRDCSTFTVVTLAGPSRWPANPHPWATWLVSSVSHSPQRPQKASSALLSHPALSFPLTFLLWSENRRPHKAPLSFSSNPRPTCVTLCSGSALLLPHCGYPFPGGPHTRDHSQMAAPVPHLFRGSCSLAENLPSDTPPCPRSCSCYHWVSLPPKQPRFFKALSTLKGSSISSAPTDFPTHCKPGLCFYSPPQKSFSPRLLPAPFL